MAPGDKSEYVLETEDEAQRLANYHEVIKLAMGGDLVRAPIDFTAKDKKIMDAGTSDGIWMIDLSNKLSLDGRTHTFVGTDISSERFPVTSSSPNISFAVHDVTQPFPASLLSAFDLVHQRLVLGGTGTAAKQAVTNLAACVKPGGWIQLVEAEQVCGDDDGPAMRQFIALIEELFEGPFRVGMELPRKMKGWIEELGFVNARTELLPNMLGEKCRDPKLKEQSVTSAAVMAKRMAESAKSILPNGVQCMSAEDFDTFVERFRDELASRGSYYPLRATWGQKPSD